jgi:hypothetical protein
LRKMAAVKREIREVDLIKGGRIQTSSFMERDPNPMLIRTQILENKKKSPNLTMIQTYYARGGNRDE